MLQRICDDEDAEHTGLSTKEMGMENSAPLIIFGGRASLEELLCAAILQQRDRPAANGSPGSAGRSYANKSSWSSAYLPSEDRCR